MRFLSRHAPVEELDTTLVDDPTFRDAALPAKAQQLLGARGRSVNSRPNNKDHFPSPETLWAIVLDQQRRLDPRSRSMPEGSDTVFSRTSGVVLPGLPVSQIAARRHGSSSISTDNQSMVDTRDSEYYDPSEQPLAVTQQTSASAARDMALRKGAPPIPQTPTSRVSPKTAAKPLRSSLKRSTQTHDGVVSSGSARAKKLDLASLFPHPRMPGGRKLSSSKSAESSPLPDNLAFFPQETRHAQIARQGSKLRLETDRSTLRSAAAESGSAVTPRIKVFEPDIFDSAKTNVYRPPKGSQHWFDGFLISSDEEEEEDRAVPAESLTTPPRSTDLRLRQYDVPLVVNSTELKTLSNHKTYPMTLQSMAKSARSTDMVSSTKAKRNSDVPLSARSGNSRVIHQRTRSMDSKTSRHRPDGQSLLSVSDRSRHVKADSPLMTDHAESDTTAFESILLPKSQRSAGPIRKPRNPQSLALEPMFQQMSDALESPDSLPIEDNGGVLLSTEHDLRSHSTKSARKKPASKRPEAFHSSPSQPTSKSNITGRKCERGEDDIALGESAGGETSSSSVPTDASRMMAVTAEEMALLELMRQRRADMKQRSFSEGYQQGLEEQPQSARESPETALEPALMVLKNDSVKSPRKSRTRSLLKEEMEQRRRLSAIKKEDVDKGFKLKRFLAMEAMTGPDRMSASKIDRFLASVPGLAGEFAERPISGTEIEVESRWDALDGADENSDGRHHGREVTSSQSGNLPRAESQEANRRDSSWPHSSPEEFESRCDDEVESTRFDEDEDFASPRSSRVLSPMERLTGKARPLSQAVASYPHGRRKEEDHYDKVRTLIASRRVSAEVSALIDQASARIRDSSTGGSPLAKTISVAQRPEEALSSLFPTPPSTRPNAGRSQTDSELPNTELGNSRHVARPERPVATSWARPTSLKHPVPQRQPLVLNFTPLESPQEQDFPSAVTSSQRSSLSPTFAMPLVLNKDKPVLTQIDSGASRSNASGKKVLLPAQDKPQKSQAGVDSITAAKRISNAISKQTDPVESKSVTRVASMASITSAGEDVLAAWMDLGGGSNPALTSGRKAVR